MKNVRLGKLWDELHSSYWFIPTVMAVAAAALAFVMLRLDRTGTIGIDSWWVYTGGADGARSLLKAVASSMMSVAATAFSITIVALQLAASNFGPRLLRNFMQDTGNQFVIGTFISTFIYCLLVLRTVHGTGDSYSQFVPQLSVTVGIILAVFSIGVLIYFIHHASTRIQASYVIDGVSSELDQAIDRLFPQKIGHGNPEYIVSQFGDIPASFENTARPINATGKGYLQAIDNEKLLNITRKHDLLLRINPRPGNFIFKDRLLVMAYPEQRVNRKISKQINDAFILGKEHTEQQDIEFPFNQLIEIAVRALSPGINDPFTAIQCIDQLASGLSCLAQRHFPSPYRYDHDNNLRVISDPVTYEELVDLSFNQIRQYARSDRAVTLRLLEAIAIIATHADNPKYRAVLRRHAEIILRGSKEGLQEEQDRKDAQQRYDSVILALKGNQIV